jgi:hypothetical protein
MSEQWATIQRMNDKEHKLSCHMQRLQTTSPAIAFQVCKVYQYLHAINNVHWSLEGFTGQASPGCRKGAIATAPITEAHAEPPVIRSGPEAREVDGQDDNNNTGDEVEDEDKAVNDLELTIDALTPD